MPNHSPPSHAISAQRSAPVGMSILGIAAVLTAFLLLHLNLALRAPVTGAEAVEIMRVSGSGWPEAGLTGLAIRLGQSVAPGVLGLRLVFLAALLGTSLCVVRTTWVLFDDRLAVGIAAIWVNTALLYGVGAVFAGPAALGAFFLTAAVWLFVEVSHRPRRGLWTAFAVCLCAAVWIDLRLCVVLPGLALAGGASENRRVAGRQVEFWIALAVAGLTAAALAWSRGLLSLDALSNGLVERDALTRYPARLVLVFVVVTPGIAAFCFLGLLHATNGLLIGHRIRLRAPVFVLGPISIVWVSTGLPLDLAMMALPLTIVLAAGHAVAPPRFAQRRWVEASTPIAFGMFVLVTALILFPRNAVTARVSVLSDMFGWQRVSEVVERAALAADAGWIAFDGTDEAALVAIHTGQIEVTEVSGGGAFAPVDCSAPGVYAVRAGQEGDVFRRFRSFSRLQGAMRHIGGQPLERFTLFVVLGPKSRAICGG